MDAEFGRPPTSRPPEARAERTLHVLRGGAAGQSGETCGVGSAHPLDGVHVVSGTVEEVTRVTINRNRSTVNGRAALSTIDTIASLLGRYGLVVVIGWIGALKFANFEAHQIQPLVANRPVHGLALQHLFPSTRSPRFWASSNWPPRY